MGGKPRPARAPNPYGGRELEGDELVAARASEALAAASAAGAAFPMITDDISAEDYVSSFKAWRRSIATTEVDLRSKATTAREAQRSTRALLTRVTDEEAALLPALRTGLENAIREAWIYERTALFAIQMICRRGSSLGNKSEQDVDAVVHQLHWRGVSKAKIARLLGKDRRDVTRLLEGADEIADVMREHLGLRKPLG